MKDSTIIISIILFFWLLFVACAICQSNEQINSHCYIFDKTYVCEPEAKQQQKQEPQIIKKEADDIIINVSWEKYYTEQEICNAIYIIEGKEKARQPFGIETIECKTFEKCEQICLNTVKNKRTAWNQEGDFLEYLAKKYCPYNWKVWLKNLKFYLARG